MNIKLTHALITLLLLVVPGFVANARAQVEKQKAEKTASLEEKYKFDTRAYDKEPKKGFALVMKLIVAAKKENAPPEVIARLYNGAAFLQRTMTFRSEGEKDFSTSIAILNTVINNPDRYLANYESAVWYINCVALQSSILGRQENSKAEISRVLKLASKSLEAETRLSKREKLYATCRLRLRASDVALNRKDWQQAIEWVKPVLAKADDFLQDEEGASRIAMAARQQSYFLFNNGDLDKSSQVIDSMCQSLENANKIPLAKRLSWQCMLRGKHLFNFQNKPTHRHSMEGWKKYESLRKRIRLGKYKQNAELLRSLANMDRMAIASMTTDNLDRSIQIIDQTIAMFRENSKLRDPDFRALWYLQDMGRMLYNDLRLKKKDLGAALNLRQKVDGFLAECYKAAEKK